MFVLAKTTRGKDYPVWNNRGLSPIVLDLRESGMIHCTLEVRYIKTLENRTGKSLWHMGCKFVDQPPADETLIQRFMARIEAERRALAAG